MAKKYIVYKKECFSDIEGKAIIEETAKEVNTNTTFGEIQNFIEANKEKKDIISVKIIAVK